MTNAEAVQRQLAAVTSARSEVAVFVRMDGRLAVINIGTATVAVPCVGFYPPVPGMPVRVDWINGSAAVTGPVVPLNPLGVITATGNPRATVEVDGVSYTLPVMASYTAEVGDDVAINWNMGVITGKLAAVDTPESPNETPDAPKPFELVVRAQASARYQGSSRWGNSDPWASDNNRGLWVYDNAVRDALAGALIASADIYLPLVQEVGNCSIGVHEYGQLPGFFPTITEGTNLPLGSRGGWQRLPQGWAEFFALGQRGVGVYSSGGYNIWRGVSSDPLSGALRIRGSR